MEESGPAWVGLATLVIMIGLFQFYRVYCERSRKALMPVEERALEEKWIA
jgi:hypothetical protein